MKSRIAAEFNHNGGNFRLPEILPNSDDWNPQPSLSIKKTKIAAEVIIYVSGALQQEKQAKLNFQNTGEFILLQPFVPWITVVTFKVGAIGNVVV